MLGTARPGGLLVRLALALTVVLVGLGAGAGAALASAPPPSVQVHFGTATMALGDTTSLTSPGGATSP